MILGKTIASDSRDTLALFFLLTIVFYFVGYWLVFRFERGTPLMMSVGAATIATCLFRRRALSTLGWGWGSWKYQWQSYLIPLGLIGTAYMVIWLVGLGGWYNVEFVAEQKDTYNLQNWSDTGLIIFHFSATATIGFLLLLPSVLGEEIAWRGFLVPELAKFMSFTGVAITSGLLWSVWHWPMMFKGIYGNDGTPLYFQLICFTAFITACGVIMTYLRLKSGSLWTAVIFHMSLNVFLQKVFTPLTVETANSDWYLDEGGAVLAIISSIAAIYFWNLGRKEFPLATDSRFT